MGYVFGSGLNAGLGRPGGGYPGWQGGGQRFPWWNYAGRGIRPMGDYGPAAAVPPGGSGGGAAPVAGPPQGVPPGAWGALAGQAGLLQVPPEFMHPPSRRRAAGGVDVRAAREVVVTWR